MAAVPNQDNCWKLPDVRRNMSVTSKNNIQLPDLVCNVLDLEVKLS